MTTVQVSYPGMPKLLDVANRVLRESGAYTVNTLNPGNVQSQVVLDALNDGIWQIYNRNRWQWTNTTIGIDLLPMQMDYPMPADFDRISMQPTYNGFPLREYTQDEWGSVIVPYISQGQTVQGSPAFFKVSPAVLTLWPAPTSDSIANVPQLMFNYYKTPGVRFDNTDDTVAPNLPAEFLDCLVSFGKWRLKTFLEYPDAMAEAQRFEQLLQVQMNRDDRGRKPNQMRQMFGPTMISQGSWFGS